MTKKQRASEAVERLEKVYPAVCSLEATDAFQLLVATRLSAQCTDARVNMVTPHLFSKYPDAKAMANADISEIEECIKSCGLYKTKAKSLVEMSKTLCEKFNGEVPATMEELTSLSGIGRKTANLILGDIFGQPAVVCDTHLIRITNRLGLISTKDPYKAEMELRKILPMDKASNFCHRIVHFGRDICTARSPKCDECPLDDICHQKK